MDHSENARSLHSDTSTYYHKLVVYADASKKGAGGTNEVRAKLGEMLKSAGLVTSFYDINLMGLLSVIRKRSFLSLSAV